MTNEEAQAAGESVPHVFDRIADVARGINDHTSGDRQTFSTAEPITIERTSADASITVVLADGRLTHLVVDQQALEERRFSAIALDLVALINAALDEHEQKNMEEFSRVSGDFGALVASLGQLQSDLHSAFERDMRSLGG